MFKIEITTNDKTLYQDIIDANILDEYPMQDMAKATDLMNKIPDFITIFIAISSSFIATAFYDWLKKRFNKNSPEIPQIKISNTTNYISIDELKIKIDNFYNQNDK